VVSGRAVPALRLYRDQTWRGPPSASSPSTTSAARRSSGSRKARARSSGPGCHAGAFAANAVRLQLHALAYNLGNFMRTLAMPKAEQPWSLTSLHEKVIKIGAKVVSHARYVTFQMAEVAVPRQMFAEILSLIARLRAPTAPA
jgi:Transposase DDE domain group 1